MITFETKGFDAAIKSLGNLQKQVEFAASKALNATGKAVADAMPAEIEKVIDRPTPFTKRGVRVLRYANKGKLETTVGFATAQARYMRWQIEGGTRNPGPAGLKIPAAINVDAFGNIPKGMISKLIAVARKERKLAKATSRRVKVSNKVDLFYGDPKDQTGKPWPRGIYKVTNGQLIPLVIFPVTAARYRPRLDFPRIAENIIRKEWPRQFEIAMANALSTAK